MAWKKYSGNPVLGSKELGTCFDIDVHYVNNRFRMYFSWRPKASIAFCESEDGIHWDEPRIVLSPVPETGWEDRINRSRCLWVDGLCHIWYTGQANGFSRMGHAISEDGIHFCERTTLPVLIPEFPWERESVMNPFVLFEDTRRVFRMWYAAGETYEPNAIGYAESDDGLAWRKSPINPIFVKGTATCEQQRVGGCHVEPRPDGTYAMYYIGYEDIHTARICVAYSPDGITRWQRDSNNPIVDIGAPGEWDHDACYKPSVCINPKTNQRMLWYNGRTAHDEYIGLVQE
jgi:predicted GH43/DUF377 family glycosyl hydrolase